MNILRDISIFWALEHTLPLFLMLFEPRYSWKKTIVILVLTILPLTVANVIIAGIVGIDKIAITMLLTLALPSLFVYWILAKHRDGRLYFTFCMADMVVLELVYITQILNHYITPDTYIFMFVFLLITLPLIEWFTYKKLRSTFLNVQKNAKQGWGIFAIISTLFYLLMTLVMAYPTPITSRPEYLPAAILLFILIPVIHVYIVSALWRQQKLHEIIKQEDILKLQVSNMTARIEELAAADEKFRMERHNYRHKMKTIASLVEMRHYEELALLVKEYNETFRKTQVIRYCKNAVIDAVLSTYIKTAASKGIKVDLGFAFPDPIPVNENELATVFANAIENAIHANEKLDEQMRHIEIKVICKPRFMIMIRNNFNGDVVFDEQGIPVNYEEGHGFGTRSIVAFCNKHNAHYIFKTEGQTFTLYLNF